MCSAIDTMMIHCRQRRQRDAASDVKHARGSFLEEGGVWREESGGEGRVEAAALTIAVLVL